mmetsp:Transcript_14326/g.24378  ORF Transcript_14326/g.24378 Transcript_14326/m.24378 type:complete len:96 (+) Transcript_14326:134-421(+)
MRESLGIEREYLMNYKSLIGEVVKIPHLVGMIILGCLARNYWTPDFNGDVEGDCYPDEWAFWIRQICLSIILMMGGLEISFKGKGTLVFLITVCP